MFKRLLAMLALGLFFVKHLRPPVQPPLLLQCVGFPPVIVGFLFFCFSRWGKGGEQVVNPQWLNLVPDSRAVTASC